MSSVRKRNKTPDNGLHPLVSIVILNWNGAQDTVQCLESLTHVEYDNFEVIVVDNGSEQSIEPLENFKGLPFTLVKNPVNRGFAGGQVSALPYCSGDILMLLNNDAIIDPKAVKNAVAVLQANKNVAAVGGKSYGLEDDGTKSLNFYSYQRLDPVNADSHTYGLDDGKMASADNVSGSCAFIRRAAIEVCGYFDERFFAYYEETDLFARFRRGGWDVVYEPSVIIWHKDGASTRNKRYMYYYLYLRNQFLLAYKNFDKASLKQFKKTYYRNFWRSLYLYLRNGGKKEAIHKARTMSTLWNLRGILKTKADRRAVQKLNPQFSYNRFLFTNSPVPVSVVVDLRSEQPEAVTEALQRLILGDVKPAEVLVISNKPVDLPEHSNFIRVENIVDRGTYELTDYDWLFMTSTHDILFRIDGARLATVDSVSFSQDIEAVYRTMIANEARLLFKGTGKPERGTPKLLTHKDLQLIALKKTDLVTYLTAHHRLYTIDDTVMGHYVKWLFAQCKPIFSQSVRTEALANSVVPNDSLSDFPILSNPFRWHIKDILIRSHLMRIIVIVKRRLRPKHSVPASSEPSPQDPTPATAESIETSLPYEPIKEFSPQEVLDTPIFFNTRDRFEPLEKFVSWLQEAGHTHIIFVDNDSSYPPLISFLQTTSLQHIPLGRNGMHKAPWESFAIRFFAKGKPYIVSDPDILPTDESPKNTVEKLYQTLVSHPQFQKAGVALKIDDLPEHYSLRESVIEWESRFWDPAIVLEKDVYAADLDTTFALYQPDTWWHLSPSIRVAGDYSMRHEPWYQDLDNPTEDMLYYRLRASNKVSTWIMGKLPKHHLRALKKEGLLPKEALERIDDEEDEQ